MYDCDSLEIPIRTKILALMHVIHYILPSLLSSCHMHLDFFSLTFGDFTLLWVVPFYICVLSTLFMEPMTICFYFCSIILWSLGQQHKYLAMKLQQVKDWIWRWWHPCCVIDVESIQWSGEKHGLRGHELNLFYKKLIDLFFFDKKKLIDLMLDVLNFFFFLYL